MGVRLSAAIAAAFLISGCVHEVARFTPQGDQQAIYRDGNPAIVSRKAGSIVMVQPASRQFQVGVRPVYVVGIYNLGAAPLNFAMRGVAAHQIRNGQVDRDLKVYTFEQLVAEEKARQFVVGLLTVVTVGANAAAAANSGHYTAHGTVYGRGGPRHVTVSGYSPTANAINQARAASQNEAMVGNVIEQGRHNLASLEQGVLKDNTMMPGEWYGGQLHIDPVLEGDRKFRISIQVGPDVHEIDVAHESVT